MRRMQRMYRGCSPRQLASKAGGNFRMLLAVLAPLLVARVVSTTCTSSLPSNIDAGMLQANAIELLQRSATFRQQCTRVASAHVLRVTLRVSTAVEVGAR